MCVQVHQTLVNIQQGGGGGPVLQQTQQQFWLLQSQLLGLKVNSCGPVISGRAHTNFDMIVVNGIESQDNFLGGLQQTLIVTLQRIH